MAPVGTAWQNAGGLLPASDPDFVDLFDDDDYHGNDNGYYLTAAVFYSRIFGQSPDGLHAHPAVASLGLNLTVSPSFLETTAWQTVLDQPQSPVSFVQHPVSQTVNQSNPVAFSILVEGSPPYSIQWHSNGIPIPNANTFTYRIPATTPDMDGTVFTVVLSNNISSAISQEAVLTVLTSNTPPLIHDAHVQIVEHSAAGTPVYDVNDANTGTDLDADGQPLTYSIVAGNPNNAFLINPNTGVIQVNNPAAVNYETSPSFTLTVAATDGVGNDTAQVVVDLIDVDEAPGAGTVFLVDFGEAASPTSHGPLPNDPTNYWNNLPASVGITDSGQLSGLITVSNEVTSVNLVMLSRFNGSNPNGTTDSPLFPPNATRDTLFGNTEVFQGLSNVFPSFKLTGLNPNLSYEFTFFASRTGVTDNRETGYFVTGANSGFVALNPSNNTTNVALIDAIRPTALGEITISLSPTPNNNNANHFTYLGAMRVRAHTSVATVMLTDLNHVYDGTAKTASVETIPPGLAVELTYDGSPAPPTNAGVYEVIATVTDASYVGSATNTLFIAQAEAVVALTNTTQVYDGTPKSALAITDPPELSVLLLYDFVVDPPVNAGTYELIATVVDPNFFGSVSNVFTILKAPVAITLGNLTHVYDGTPKSATAETVPEGLTVQLTYNGLADPPTNAGTYQVIGTVVDANYFGAATNSLVIDKAPATVTLTDLAHVYDGSAKTAGAETDPAGLTVLFSYNGLPDAPTNAGTYEVIGTIADNNYAGSATNTFVIAQAEAIVTLADLAHVYDGSAKAASAQTVPEGLTVQLTYNGLADPPTNAGTYQVIGTVVDANYFGAATNSLMIAPAELTVTADDKQKPFGSADPVYTATITGFVNNETEAVLMGTLTFSREPGEQPGNYAITPSGLSATNYSVAFIAGTLTITAIDPPILLPLQGVNTTNIVITWTAVPDVTYRVLYSTNLTSGVWIPLSPDVIATNDTASLVDTPGAEVQRFYRVTILDPSH